MLMGLEAVEGMVNTVRAAPTNMSNAKVLMVHDGLKHHLQWSVAFTWPTMFHCTGIHGPTISLFLDEAVNGKLKNIVVPPHGLLQAPPCGVPHRAWPRARGSRDSRQAETTQSTLICCN